MSILPVTVLSGFLGAGKTTVLQNILNNRDGLRVAVIVNDMSEINIDAQIIRTEEKLVELSNGCICCTLREDLLIAVRKIAEEKRFDYLVIESSGISEPLPVAETFTFADENGQSLGDVARLDTMVTVVDAYNFLLDYKDSDSLAERALALGESDQRNITDLLIDQVEFADVILVNKVDRVGEEDLAFLEGLLRRLNPSARLIRTHKGEISRDSILGTGRFDFERAALSPGWLQELRGTHPAETDVYGISSFVFRRPQPFDAARLYAFLEDAWEAGVIRLKGFVWLASRPKDVGILALASRSCVLEPGGEWAGNDTHPGQELVIIGQHMDHSVIEIALEQCLLKDGIPFDAQIGHDPFPPWQAVH